MATNILGIKITAQDATAGAVRSAVAGMQSLQTAAGGANRVLAGLGVGVSVGAFVAYTKSIIDGVDALNDLKDATGASIENISALEDVARRSGASLDAVGTSLVKLNQALNAAKPGGTTEAAVKAIGLSVSELKALDPAEAFRRIAVGLEGFADDANKARLTQELFGKSLKEVAPLLKDLAAQGALNATVTTAQAEEVEKFNKQMFALQKNVTDASRSLVSDMVPALNAVFAAMQNGGLMKGLDELGNQLFDWSGHEARQDIQWMTDEIADLREQQALITVDIFGKKGAIQADIDVKIAALQAAKDAYFKLTNGSAGGGRGSVNPAFVDGRSSAADIGSGDSKKLAGISAAQKLVNDGLALYNDLMAEAAGYSKTYTEDITKLAAAYQATSMTAEQYATALAAINAAQPGAVQAEKDRIDAAKLNTQAVDDLFDAQEKLRLANEEQIKTGRTMLEQIEYETLLLGLNAEQRAMAALERELETQGIVKGTQAYDAYIAKLREATAIKTAKEAGIKSTEELAEANKKAAEESSKYWEDALMRAFESGKGFFESLWDTIKNTLKTQVLKVLVTGSISGLGLTGAANAATGSAGILSSLSNLPTTISNLASAVTSLPSLLSSSSMGVLDIAGFNPWLAAGAALLAVVANLDKGETRAGGQYGYSMDGATAYNARRNSYVDASGVGATFLEGPSGGDPYGQVVSTAINSTVDHINALFKAIGSTTAISAFQAGYETSEKGRGGVFAGGTLTGGVTFGESGTGDNYQGTLYDSSKGFNLDAKAAVEALSLDLKQATIEALQAATDMPKAIANMIKVDAKSLTDEAATSLLTSIDALVNDVVGLRGALDTLPFADLRDLSFDAAAGLIAASGNLEALANNLAGYYDNFYSESEKTANLTQVLGDDFAALGLTMPTDNLREWYRTQVEAAMAADQSVPANAALTASLLSMQGGVNTLADSAETAAQRIIDAAAKLQEQIFAAQESAMSEYMSAQLEYNSLIASEQEQAAQAMQAAADALASAGQGIQAFIDSLLNTPANAKDNYLSDLALARGGDVEASKRLPTSGRAYLDAQIAASTTSAEARIAQARMAAELSNLPAVKSYEQQLLEAVGGTTAAVKDLNGKLITELTVTARSEITKLINFVANTDDLPTDLKELALGATSTFTKTVEYVLGSVLSPDMQALALEQNSTLTKTVRLALGDDLPDETKRIVLMASESVSKTIGLVAFSTMSADQQAMVLQTTGSITKTISLAAGELDQVALGVAFAQSGTIERIVKASGGVLTPEQQQLLSAVDVYNKTVNIDVKLDATELTAFQTMLKEIFGTISIPGISGDGLGGVDLTDIVGQAYLDRLQSINTYINSLDWSLENSKASAWATYYAAQQYGVSQADIANATGLNYSDIQALFDSANVPRFAMGTNYLPSDMLAQVHQGERIIPAADNRELMSRLQDPQQNSVALVAEIKALRDDNAAQARAMVQLQQRLTKLMERWDSNGVPSQRIET